MRFFGALSGFLRRGTLGVAAGNQAKNNWSKNALVLGGCVTLFSSSVYVWKKVVGTSLLFTASCNSSAKQKGGKFSGKVVLITGAAGDIGGATAERFACDGATVILSDLPSTERVLKAKCNELCALGAVRPIIIPADVTDEKDVINMVSVASLKAGRIDILFNNAGLQGELRPIYEQKDSEFKRVTNVNIYGVYLCLKYVSKAMIAQKTGGVIVNSASLAGLLGPANMAAYAASKFAVIGMTKTAAKDLAPYRIRVNAIAPGLLEGHLWTTQVKGRVLCQKRERGDDTDITPDDISEEEKRMISNTPMKRLGKLSEVASVVAFLSSDDASYLSGVTLPIDGGRLP